MCSIWLCVKKKQPNYDKAIDQRDRFFQNAPPQYAGAFAHQFDIRFGHAHCRIIRRGVHYAEFFGY